MIVRVLLRSLPLGLLVTFLLAPQWFEPLLARLNEFGAPAIYDQGSLPSLALAHVATVIVATLASAGVAVAVAAFVTRPAGARCLPLSRALIGFGHTFPPVAMLALAVPMVGFGLWPTLFALFAYGMLPVFENSLAGFEACPRDILEAADGMGMSRAQRLLGVELPLALPSILEGIRLSLVVNVGTATLGSTVAARGLGEVIIAGLLSSNTAFVLQGALLTGLLAILLYEAMHLLERRLVPAGRGGS